EPPAGGGLVAMAAATSGGNQVAAVLGRHAVLGGVGAEVRADRAGDDALPFLIARDRAAELFDDAHGLVADREALGDRIFALEDVDVGTADRGGGDADQRVVGPDIRNGLFDQFDTAGFDEYGGFHGGDH